MPLIDIVITLIVVGVVLWLIDLIPMNNTIKKILNAIVIIVVILWVLSIFGVIDGFDSLLNIRIG
jgi:hypothetical protein